jgi:hypothetical protein
MGFIVHLEAAKEVCGKTNDVVSVFRYSERSRPSPNAPLPTKNRGPSWGGGGLSGERPRETSETRHTSPQPSRDVQRKGAAPLSGAEEQTARAIGAYAQYALFLFILQMGV